MSRSLLRTTALLLGILAASTALLVPATSRRVLADTPATSVSDAVEEWIVGNGLIYWANNCFADEFNPFAILKRKPASGGPQQTIESINDGARCNTYQHMLSSGDGLYYFNRSQSQIERMPLGAPFTASVVKTLTSDQAPIGGRSFVEANNYLYWISSARTILRLRKDGNGAIETVANTGSGLSDVMVVGSSVYWSDRSGIWRTSISCDALPCTGNVSQFSNIGDNARPYGLLYQSLGGFNTSYRVYWVEQVTSGQNSAYTIRYRACSQFTICFVLPPEDKLADPPPTFYTGTTNWFIGYPALAGSNIYWTEDDSSLSGNANGDVKRKAYNAATPGAETIATAQGQVDSQLVVEGGTLFFARQNIGIFSLSLSASAITREFSADGLEVTQAIQNLANSAPLVAEKTTYVRAYARQLSGPSTPNVQARLVGLKNNLPLPGSPLQPINGVRALVSGGSFDRARLNDGWYFLLPASWIGAGSISLRFEVDPNQIHTDPNRNNNQLSQTVSFEKVPPICVWTVPVRTHSPKPSINDPNFWAMVDHFKRRWPTPDVWIFRDTDPVEELEVCTYYGIPYPCHGPYELEDGWGIGGPPDRDKVIMSLWTRAQLSFNPDVCDDIGAPVHFMGLVHPEANNGGSAGYASTVSKQSWVQLPDHTPNPILPGWDQLREGSVMAQELAHNYGRKHVDCGDPEDVDSGYPYPPCQIATTGPTSYYGFDVTTLQPIRPEQTADFMSYAGRSWVSDYTWRALLTAIKNDSAAARATTAAARRATTAAAGDSVFVTGLVDADNQRGELSVVLILPTNSVPPSTLQTLRAQAARPRHVDGAATAYTLRLLSPSGAVLVERQLTLTMLDDHSSEGASALFSDLFPQPAGQVAEVQLLAGGVVVDSLKPGASPPTLEIQQPVGGALIDDALTIQWYASDANPDDRLLFTVQYSHDAGASWHTLALNVPGGPGPSNRLSYDDLGTLHGSGTNTALIRVLASDGYNTAIATSQPFTVQNRPPEPVISTPDPGQTLAAGTSVILRGNATDAEDGGLAPTALSWRIDGASRGGGADISSAVLAPGDHSAALSAADSLGQTATTTLSFRVAPLAVPLASSPTLDGSCEDTVYATGSSVPLSPYGDGTQANARLLRSADYLWVCFAALQPAAAERTAFVGVHADSDNSRDALAQSSDFGFFVGENGDVFTRAGDGAGGFEAAGPSGLQGQVATGTTSWSAELRIDATVLGGWDHLVGLNLGHYGVSAPSDAYRWPFTAEIARPGSWAATALGNQPVLTALEPFSTTVGSPAFTLTVRGSGFVSGSVVLWNGSELPTSFVDEEQLNAQVAASLLNSAATLQIATRAPAPAGFSSNPATFVVEALAPAISGLAPGSSLARSEPFTLTVSGSNFAPDAQILWNGQPLPTQYVSPAEVRAVIDLTLLANGQAIGVAVRNLTPAERISSVVAFTVQPNRERDYLLPTILK